MMWWFVSAAAVSVLLFYSGKGPNALWGTATFGGLIGIVIAFLQASFDWTAVGKGVVIGALAGLAFELLPQVSKLWRKQH